MAILNNQLNAQYAATLEFQQAEDNSTDEICDEEVVVKDDVLFMNNQLSLFYVLSVTKLLQKQFKPEFPERMRF